MNGEEGRNLIERKNFVLGIDNSFKHFGTWITIIIYNYYYIFIISCVYIYELLGIFACITTNIYINLLVAY